MSYGVTDAGFIPKPRAAILADLQAAALQPEPAGFGADADVSSDSALGILLGLMADSLAGVWEQAARVYAQAYPDTATGDAFAEIARLTNCPQLPAAPSQMLLLFTGPVGSTIAAGTSCSGGGHTALTLTAGTIPAGGTLLLAAELDTTGPVAVPAGTIDTIDGGLPINTTVSQPADAVLGRDLELLTAWRIRRETSLRAAGGASVDAIQARVAGVLGVQECKVAQNDSDAVVDTLPAHSFEALVRHDDSPNIEQAILDAILATKPGGIYCHGTTVGTALDSGGVVRTVRYTRPTEVPIYVAVTLVTDGTESSTADVTAAAQAAVVAQEARLRIGSNVVGSRLAAAVYALGDFIYSASVTVGTAPSPTDAAVILSSRQMASLDTSRVTVTVSHAGDL